MPLHPALWPALWTLRSETWGGHSGPPEAVEAVEAPSVVMLSVVQYGHQNQLGL